MYRYLVLVILLLLFENTMASCPAYDRRDYPHWIDPDQDCQNTRHEVLVEESTVPVQFKTNKKCRVVTGKTRTLSTPLNQAFDNLLWSETFIHRSTFYGDLGHTIDDT